MTTEQLQPYQEQQQQIAPRQATAPYREERTVQLTPAQIAILTAPIPPHEMDITADGKLHVPFTTITARFNAAFGVLQWRLDEHVGQEPNPLVRPEETDKGTKYEVVLTCDLIVQGITVCTVTDSAVYFSWNAEGSFANAKESAKSKCLYEAAKAVGIGHEIKDRGYVDEWKRAYAESYENRGRTYWKKRRGEGVRQPQLDRLFDLLNGDSVMLYQALPTIAGRIMDAQQMEEYLRVLHDKRQDRNRMAESLTNAEKDAFMARWVKSGATADEVRDAAEDHTVTHAENLLWVLCRVRRSAAKEHPAGFHDPSPEPPKGGIPSDAPGLQKTSKGKPWHEYPSDALQKWYGEKEGNEKMQRAYHSAMAIKVAGHVGEDQYEALMATDFHELVRRYNELKEGTA